MNKNNIMPWALVTINASALFYLSSQPVEKSRETSSKVTEIVMETIKEISPDYYQELETREVHQQVRKTSHFVLYLMLGYLVSHALRKNQHEKISTAILTCALIAVIDESFQAFIPGRGPEINDVFLDSIGASSGIIVERLINKEKTFLKKM